MGRTMTSDGAVEQSLDPLASAEAAAQHIVDACLKDGPVGRVGLEIEANCYDMADPSRRPGWDELTATIETLPSLPGGSLVTVEPGGAVELSGPPAADPVNAVSAMTSDRDVLRTAFAQAGLGLVLLGADPVSYTHLTLPTTPYV